MSKMEPTEFLNDRYTAMEERLAVSWERREKNRGARNKPTLCSLFDSRPPLQSTVVFFSIQSPLSPLVSRPLLLSTSPFHSLQIVRKRLNRPLTLAEKVSKAEGTGCELGRERELFGLDPARGLFFCSVCPSKDESPFSLPLPLFVLFARPPPLANLYSRSYRPPLRDEERDFAIRMGEKSAEERERERERESKPPPPPLV